MTVTLADEARAAAVDRAVAAGGSRICGKRYAHVDRGELFTAAGRLEQLATPRAEPTPQVEVLAAHVG